MSPAELIERRAPGCPRDPQIDDAVVDATVKLLERVGFAETTIQAVAREAGVGVPAIYRRWANRVELIESAVFPTFERPSVAGSGDLRDDLQGYVDLYTSMFATPSARVALPALLSIYQSNPSEHRSVSERVGVEVREGFRALLHGAARGEVDPSIDPDDVLDLLIGSVLYRVFLRPFTGRPAHDDHTTDLLLDMLRPAKRNSPNHPRPRSRHA